MATNNIIEKIFIFLWFWLCFLFIVSFVSIFYFSLLLFSRSESIRNYFLSFAVKVKVILVLMLLYKNISNVVSCFRWQNCESEVPRRRRKKMRL